MRFGRYGVKESQWAPDGDTGFIGIDMRHDRGELPPGYLARGENCQLLDGTAATRPGTTFPSDFNPLFANAIIGSHIYSNPNGDQVMLVATASASYVWALQFGKDPVQIAIDASDPTVSTGTFLVHFVQAFDKVLMLRIPSTSLPPLLWDGVNTDKFMPVTNPPFVPPPPSSLIPTNWAGVPFQNRLLLYNPYWSPLPWRNQFIATDVNAPTYYDAFLDAFRVNSGESDLITSIRPYFEQSVVVYMKNSVHMVENFTIDPLQTRQRKINGRIGSVGVYGPVETGADQIFLSHSGNGFYRLSQIDVERDQVDPIPISQKIQPVIDRINWDRAFLYHSSAVLGEYGYFALTLDEKAGAADSIVKLHIPSNEWHSAPDWFLDPNVRLNRLHVTLYDGQQRLFGLDYAASRIYLMYDGLLDNINGTGLAVQYLIESRGYTCGNPGGFNRFQRGIAGIRSFDPLATVTAISDGVNEEKLVKTITKNNARFYIHGHKDFDPLTDDPNEPKREDYSTDVTDTAIEDFELLPDGDLFSIPPTSTAFNPIKQQSLERFQVRQNGRWCSLRVSNTQGQLDVLGLGVESIPISEGMKTLA